MTKPDGNVILCVGDDPVSLNRRCALLKKHGWHVLSAGTGHEGIFRCDRERVDAVVLELGDVEAALIAGEVKRLHPRMPVIMMATEGKTLIEHATEQADAVVLKSGGSTSLLAALKRVLEAT